MNEKNKLVNTDIISGLTNVENESVDLSIADPPYYKVVNQKWDRSWSNYDDYLNWSISWISENYKKLRIGGTFYLFGYIRNVAEIIKPMREMGYSLRQQIVVDKGLRSISGRATRNYKIFPNTTESVFMFIKDPIPYSRKILRDAQKKIGISSKEINERCGVKSNGGGMWSIYTGDNVCEQLPTKELWNKLKEILLIDVEYESISQTFNPIIGHTDVWRDIDFYEEKRTHPTQKPKKLLERLILASSTDDDLVLDLFSGSGNTSIVCKEKNRRSIGIEKEKKYFDIATRRING